MAPLQVIVADDEPLARALVRSLLTAVGDAEIVGECEDGDAVARELSRARADMMLLDIRMPGRDVFAVLEEHAHVSGAAMPAVIFTTAYERYAVRAFELNAVDYLVKPLTAERFAEAIGRARQRRADRDLAAAAVGQLARDLGLHPRRLLVPERGRMVPVAIEAIEWIEAEGDYARVHSAGKSYLVARSLTDLERRLDPERFIRIHRSTIVNTDYVRDVTPAGSSRLALRLADGTRLMVSRTRGSALRQWRL